MTPVKEDGGDEESNHDNNDTQGTSSNEPVAAAAPAAAAATTSSDASHNMAVMLNSMETLTVAFGFEQRLAQRALDAIEDKSDVTAAYNWILDHGGQDKGGPISPIGNCPHLATHFNIQAEQLPIGVFQLPCSHNQQEKDDSFKDSANDGIGKTDKSEAPLSKDSTIVCPAKENWLCLECNAIRCSRYASGHALEHWQQTKARAVDNNSGGNGDGAGHCVAVSLSDLSVWCHVCESYLKHESLKSILQQLEELKFECD